MAAGGTTRTNWQIKENNDSSNNWEHREDTYEVISSTTTINWKAEKSNDRNDRITKTGWTEFKRGFTRQQSTTAINEEGKKQKMRWSSQSSMYEMEQQYHQEEQKSKSKKASGTSRHAQVAGYQTRKNTNSRYSYICRGFQWKEERIGRQPKQAPSITCQRTRDDDETQQTKIGLAFLTGGSNCSNNICTSYFFAQARSLRIMAPPAQAMSNGQQLYVIVDGKFLKESSNNPRVASAHLFLQRLEHLVKQYKTENEVLLYVANTRVQQHSFHFARKFNERCNTNRNLIELPHALQTIAMPANSMIVVISGFVKDRSLNLTFPALIYKPIVVDLGRQIRNNRNIVTYDILNAWTSNGSLVLSEISDRLQTFQQPQIRQQSPTRMDRCRIANYKFSSGVKRKLKYQTARAVLMKDICGDWEELEVYKTVVKRALLVFDMSGPLAKVHNNELLITLDDSMSNSVSFVIERGNGSNSEGGYGTITFQPCGRNFCIPRDRDALLAKVMELLFLMPIQLRNHNPSDVMEELKATGEKIYKHTKEYDDWIVDSLERLATRYT